MKLCLTSALNPLVAMGLLLAGCTAQPAPSPTPTSAVTAVVSEKPTAEPPAGVIKDSGFGKRDGYVWVTAIVHNNTDTVGQFVTVHFDLADKSGNLIASEDQTDVFDRPNGDIAVGTQLEVPKKAKVASVTTSLEVGDNTEDTGPFPAIVASKRSIGSHWGIPTAKFVLRNPLAEPISDPSVNIVCYNKKNRIIGGGIDYPDLMPAKRSIVVEADVTTNGKPHHCTAYVGAPSDWEGEDDPTTTPSSTPSGPDDAAAVGAVEAFHAWIDQYNSAEWSAQYANLVLAQRPLITEEQYVACRQGDEKTPWAWIKELGTKPALANPIPGTSVKLDSTVVNVRVKTAGMAMTLDAHMYLENGAWHWAMTKGNLKNCVG